MSPGAGVHEEMVPRPAIPLNRLVPLRKTIGPDLLGFGVAGNIDLRQNAGAVFEVIHGEALAELFAFGRGRVNGRTRQSGEFAVAEHDEAAPL